MYIIVWKKNQPIKQNIIKLTQSPSRFWWYAWSERVQVLVAIDQLSRNWSLLYYSKTCQTARAVSNQHMELVLFTYFSKHSNEEHPLAKSNIHERGMSLGPLCTLYMYGMYVIQKTTIMLRTIPKKRNQPKFSKRVCSHFANPPSPPKEQKQYHWKW